MSFWNKAGRIGAAIYTGGITEYARMLDNSGQGTKRRGAAYDQEMAQVADDQGQFKLDKYGYTPVEPGKHVAYQAQYASNKYIAARNAAIRADALHTLQGGLGLLESYRPGGAAAMTSPYYNNMAQVLMNSQLEAPDLLGQVRKASQQNANRQARNAMYAQIGSGVLSFAGAMAGGPAGAAAGKLVGDIAGQQFAGGPGTAPIPGALNASGASGPSPRGAQLENSPQAGMEPQGYFGSDQGAWQPMQPMGQQESAQYLQGNPMGGGTPTPSIGGQQGYFGGGHDTPQQWTPMQPMGSQQSAEHLQGRPMGGSGNRFQHKNNEGLSVEGGPPVTAGGGGGGGGVAQFIAMQASAEVNGVDYYGRLLAGMNELDLQAEAILYA